MPSRRRTIALLASTALAGCSTLPESGTPRARLDGVWLVNDREPAQTVAVTVRADDETVFERTQELGTAAEPTPNDGNVVVDPGLTDPGSYVVEAAVDGGDDPTSVDTTRVVDGEEDCVLVRFTLTRGSGVQTWTKATRQCDEGDER